MNYEELKVGDILLYDKALIQEITSLNRPIHYNFTILYLLKPWMGLQIGEKHKFGFVPFLTKKVNKNLKIIKVLYGS